MGTKAYRIDQVDGAPETCGVYVIYFTHSPSKFYVGSAKNFKKRWKQHVAKLKSRKHSNYKLKRLFASYRNELRFQVYKETADTPTARIEEQTVIDFVPHERLYNLDFTVYKHRND